MQMRWPRFKILPSFWAVCPTTMILPEMCGLDLPRIYNFPVQNLFRFLCRRHIRPAIGMNEEVGSRLGSRKGRLEERPGGEPKSGVTLAERRLASKATCDKAHRHSLAAATQRAPGEKTQAWRRRQIQATSATKRDP